jgi:hypothetical protein
LFEADTWVALDASFKQYVYLQGLDAIAIAELDVEQLVDDFAASGTIDEELGFVQNLDIGLIAAAQERVADAMQTITRLIHHPTYCGTTRHRAWGVSLGRGSSPYRRVRLRPARSRNAPATAPGGTSLRKGGE